MPLQLHWAALSSTPRGLGLALGALAIFIGSILIWVAVAEDKTITHQSSFDGFFINNTSYRSWQFQVGRRAGHLVPEGCGSSVAEPVLGTPV